LSPFRPAYTPGSETLPEQDRLTVGRVVRTVVGLYQIDRTRRAVDWGMSPTVRMSAAFASGDSLQPGLS